MKNKLLFGLMIFSSLGIMTGCGKEKAVTHTDSTGKITYEECTLTMDWWGGDTRHEATQEAIKAFEEKYPGIKVEVSFGAWGDWETAKAAEYIAGNNPDVQQTNYDWIAKYDTYGTTYLDMNTVSDVFDLSQYSDDVLDMVKDSNGGIAGIPVSITGRTFYWNKDTFEKAGLSVPTTLDELVNAGKVFKEKLGDNYYPLSINAYDRAILCAYYLQAQTGKPIINEDNELTVTKNQLEDGLKWISSLEKNHVIPTIEYIDGEGVESMDKSGRFINGEYAGVFEWDSTSGKYTAALGDNAGNLVVGNVFPELKSYSKVSLMFSISAKTKHPHESGLLLQFLLNDPEGVKIMGNERGIPESKAAYDALLDNEDISELSAQAHKAVLDSDPVFWNPLFDNSLLKGDTAAYNVVFGQLSYGKDVAGNSYGVSDASEELYNTYMQVLSEN